jgi:uncharacterized protein (TIGR02246 family)
MGEKASTSPVVRLGRVVSVCAGTVALGVLSVWTPAAAAGQAAGDFAAIRARIETYLAAAWDAHDASALGAIFTEDADLVMGNLPAAWGRREIQDSWQTYFRRQEPERRLQLDVASLRFLTPGVATMTVTTTTGGPDSEGRELPARRFRGSWVWRRQRDVWLISAMRGLPLEEDRVDLNATAEAAETLRPDIRGFVAAYEDALNAKDLGALSAFYSDDAELIVRNSPLVSGRQAIEAWWRAYLAEPRPYRALLIIDDIRRITPDVTLLNGTATGALPQQAAERPTPVRYTRWTWVLVREAGEWRIAQLLVLPSEDDRIIRSGSRPN